jgi:hypothetical protein
MSKIEKFEDMRSSGWLGSQRVRKLKPKKGGIMEGKNTIT